MSAAANRGEAIERTSLAWARTAQTALGCAAVFAKVSVDRDSIGWIGVALSLAVAVIAWWLARQRGAEAGPAQPRPVPTAVVSGLCVALGVVAVVLIALN